jgi:hypothetical protein
LPQSLGFIFRNEGGEADAIQKHQHFVGFKLRLLNIVGIVLGTVLDWDVQGIPRMSMSLYIVTLDAGMPLALR